MWFYFLFWRREGRWFDRDIHTDEGNTFYRFVFFFLFVLISVCPIF